MPARLTAYLPDRAAPACLLRGTERLRIGRGDDCDLVLDHPSVSRLHAELLPDGEEAWRLVDLGSKNGSFVDGVALPAHGQVRLARDAWLRIGDLYCEFCLLDESRLGAESAGRRARQTRAAILTAGIAVAGDFDALLEGSLAAVIELAHCERGFLLLRDGDDYVVRTQRSLDATVLCGRGFSGSVGAVDRTLSERRPIIVNDIGGEAWLASRASVAAAGLGAIACLPLLDGDQAIGAVYVDRRGAGEAITTLDLALLEAFVERTAVYITARRASDTLANPAVPGWRRIAAAHARMP